MRKRECIAMLLAGGQGSRLGGLTTHIAKPAVVFGGKYRMIDFTLSNCFNSNIDVVGVLTQYRPLMLNNYIGTGTAWGLSSVDGGVTILPPYQSREGFNWYRNTAAAVYQNIEFIDYYSPDYVLILSGDHIYKMDYSKMLAFHKLKGADVTISVYPVPWEEASRFGIMVADEEGKVERFEEKPREPVSNLASMGIYIFNWAYLKDALLRDYEDKDSANDFGKNIIPKALAEGKRLYAYRFNGYWKDAGTIDSYYEASMELLDGTCSLELDDPNFPIYSNNQVTRPQYIGPEAHVSNSYVCDGCTVLGEVEHSVISNDVTIGRGAKVSDSIVLHGAVISDGAQVVNAIVNENAVIPRGSRWGKGDVPAGTQVTVISDIDVR